LAIANVDAPNPSRAAARISSFVILGDRAMIRKVSERLLINVSSLT
jgi:hypothetical protein